MKAGDPIVAVVGGHVRNTHAWRHATYFIAAHPGVAAWASAKRVALIPETEGVEWARGHEGPAVDALRVAVALRGGQ